MYVKPAVTELIFLCDFLTQFIYVLFMKSGIWNFIGNFLFTSKYLKKDCFLKVELKTFFTSKVTGMNVLPLERKMYLTFFLYTSTPHRNSSEEKNLAIA